MTEPSPYKCQARLLRWPAAVAKLQQEIDRLSLELSLLDDLDRRPVLVAKRRELLVELEVAKRDVLAREVPEL
jgi:hypothetical protein